MKFVSSDNYFFELLIQGYQFPKNSNDYWDSNWLFIQINVSANSGSWSYVDACLVTFEIERLADWLDSLSAGDFRKPSLFFTENVLEFHIVEDSDNVRCLRVLCRDFVPENCPKVTARLIARDELCIDFELSEIDLGAAANDLRRQLEVFPQRAKRQRLNNHSTA